MAKSYDKHKARSQEYTRNQRIRDAEQSRLKRASSRLAAHIEQAIEDQDYDKFSGIYLKSGK